jgi:hypothetical protein
MEFNPNYTYAYMQQSAMADDSVHHKDIVFVFQK